MTRTENIEPGLKFMILWKAVVYRSVLVESFSGVLQIMFKVVSCVTWAESESESLALSQSQSQAHSAWVQVRIMDWRKKKSDTEKILIPALIWLTKIYSWH